MLIAGNVTGGTDFSWTITLILMFTFFAKKKRNKKNKFVKS